MQAFRVSGSELADILGLTPTRVTQLAKEGMPRHPHGGFDLRAAAGWYCGRLRQQTESSRSELAIGRARLATARADHEELELAERRGELVRAEEVRNSAFSVARLSRDSLLSIPDRISAVIAGMNDEADIHHVLADEIRRSLSTLSDRCKALAAGADGVSMSDSKD